MKFFTHDILVCDFEVTEFDVDKNEPVQVGLILLDRETLEQKWSYSSWIKPIQPISTDLEGFRWASLDEGDIVEINKAPSLEEVAKEIKNYYLKDIIYVRGMQHLITAFGINCLKPLG